MDLILWNYADFYRRYVAVSSDFPDMLLWFIFSLPKDACERRQLVATQICDGKVMEPNARKIFANFEDDVKHAKKSGT